MIKKLKLQGFKCFIDEDFDIEPLTVLSGLNSSGKSSVLQSVRILKDKKPLDGHGPFSEFVSSHAVRFTITAHNSEDNECLLSYGSDDIITEGDLFDDHSLFSYISAGRLGPKTFLPIWTETILSDVGQQGEYVLDFLDRYSEFSGLPEKLCHKASNSTSVRLNIAAWLNLISPGVEFEYFLNRKADIGTAEFSKRRPTNVGFGLSYTLPIIANVLVYASLIANKINKSALILIENPEAHLHPTGQTRMGEFLAFAAASGVQIIIETHSDHILNGIRLAVKEQHLSRDDTSFYFFSYDFDAEKSNVDRPVLDEFGMFDEWPDGFFDETEKILGKLI